MILPECRSHEERSDSERWAMENYLQRVVERGKECTLKRSQIEGRSFGGGNCLSST